VGNPPFRRPKHASDRQADAREVLERSGRPGADEEMHCRKQETGRELRQAAGRPAVTAEEGGLDFPCRLHAVRAALHRKQRKNTPSAAFHVVVLRLSTDSST
jgi:hypothetical protein